jgi:protein FAM32A
MSSYDNVATGKLKLKKAPSGSKAVQKKQVEVVSEAQREVAEDKQPADEVVDNRTAAQKKFDELAEKRRREQLQKAATKSHRQRIVEFNKKLANLSEHNDLPKIGPG